MHTQKATSKARHLSVETTVMRCREDSLPPPCAMCSQICAHANTYICTHNAYAISHMQKYNFVHSIKSCSTADINMATPTALLVSCSASVDPHEIVRKVTECDDHTLVCPIAEDVQGYPWQLSNKYYTADVLLCVAAPCVMGSLSLGESMEGLIIVIDDQEQSFKSAKSQWSTVKEINPEVKILACKQFTKSPGVPKKDVLEWCLDHSFELVELEKPEDEDEEEEDGFGVEPYGVKRIISALHAHTWSNLEMKDDNGANLLRLQERFGDEDSHANPADLGRNRSNDGYLPLSNDCEQNVSEQEANNQEGTDTSRRGAAGDSSDPSRSEASETVNDAARTRDKSEASADDASNVPKDMSLDSVGSNRSSSGSCNADKGSQGAINGSSSKSAGSGAGGSATGDEKKKRTAEPDRIDAVSNEDAKLFEALGNDDPGSESFEQLFSRMALMKEKASCLEGEERRRYAEKVAVAFWRAIGGDEEEIDGLDDDSD